MATANDVKRALRAVADPERARHSQGFFKTGAGQYGEGDQFLGVRVPVQRRIARQFRGLPLGQISRLLKSAVHEDRLTALLLLVDAYERAEDEPERQRTIVEAYLGHLRYVNNWDLVDTSAPRIWGNWLLRRDRAPLYEQIRSERLWTRRVAMLATLEFIRHGEAEDALALCELCLADREDLMHKASGWMLREVGDRVGLAPLRRFLKKHSRTMPRTMLRYAIEKLPKPERERWLA
jgi:3-methyladenine DNA glycosylase AlkD